MALHAGAGALQMSQSGGIDPVCLVHGKRKSEHHCLYCALCFIPLTVEKCSYLPDGTQHDVCVPCATKEYEILVQIAQGNDPRKRSA